MDARAGTSLICLDDQKLVGGLKYLILGVVCGFLLLQTFPAEKGCLRFGLRSMKKTIPIAHTSMAFRSSTVNAVDILFSNNISGGKCWQFA